MRTAVGRTTTMRVAGAALLIGLLAACGGSTKVTSASAPSTSATTTSTGASGVAPTATAAITIKNFMFMPMSMTVKAGTTVTWTNDDVTPHDIEFQGGIIPTSPQISAGGGPRSWSHTFTTPGTYPYVCGIHTYMTGTIKVTA